jgi:seryl-tRNA synthetase
MSTEQEAFRDALVERGLLIPSTVPGVFGRGPVFHDLMVRVERMLDPTCREPGTTAVHFPAITPREVLRKTGYMESVPQLCGSVHAFTATDKELPALVRTVAEGGTWSPHLSQTDVVLTPAACYPLYPTLRGTLPEGGRLFDLTGNCFRHEPSPDPMRMQAFLLRENVRVGSPEDVRAWREKEMNRGLELLLSLGLPARLALASDPFFGRGGKMLTSNQMAQQLKFEVVVAAYSPEKETAVASFNYHEDHFTAAFDIRTHDGEIAHTACLGFGLERLALSLLKVHGLVPTGWPASVRARVYG